MPPTRLVRRSFAKAAAEDWFGRVGYKDFAPDGTRHAVIKNNPKRDYALQPKVARNELPLGRNPVGILCGHQNVRGVVSPNGAAAQSPRLARTRLPWVNVANWEQPQRGCGTFIVMPREWFWPRPRCG